VAIAMLVILLTSLVASSVPLPGREENQVINNQDRFDDTTKKWTDKLKKEIDSLKRNYNTKIDRLDIELNSYELSQDVKDSISRTIMKLIIEIGKLEKVHWEIEYLSRSNQTYRVIEYKKLHVPAFTSFNKKSGELNIHIISGALIGLFAHELLHIYQFDRGLTSLGHAGDTGRHFLHDSTDEIAAYKRQEMLGDTVDYRDGVGLALRKEPYSIYNFKQDTGRCPVNLPELIRKGSMRKLKKVAKTMHQAYRVQIDGKWITIPIK
jgi:hypothetical protein